MEEMMEEVIGGAAREVVRVWLDRCAKAAADRDVEDNDRPALGGRDDLVKRKTVEIDLAANLPRLFGPEVAGRVLAEIQKGFGV